MTNMRITLDKMHNIPNGWRWTVRHNHGIDTCWGFYSRDQALADVVDHLTVKDLLKAKS